jgi:hypothetical protein
MFVSDGEWQSYSALPHGSSIIHFILEMRRAAPQEAADLATTRQRWHMIPKVKFRTASWLSGDGATGWYQTRLQASKTHNREQLLAAASFAWLTLARIPIASWQCRRSRRLAHARVHTKFSRHFQLWQRRCIGTNCGQSAGQLDRCLASARRSSITLRNRGCGDKCRLRRGQRWRDRT